MAKKIDIVPFGIGQQIWFSIDRLARVEELLKKPIGDIIQESEKLSLNNMLILLQVGMRQNGEKSKQYYEQKIEEAIENGFNIIDIQTCVLKAVAGSGIMGKAFYFQMFPEELTTVDKAAIEEEKNE